MKTAPCFLVILVTIFAGCENAPVIKSDAKLCAVVAANPMRVPHAINWPTPVENSIYRVAQWYFGNEMRGELRLLNERQVVSTAQKYGINAATSGGSGEESFAHVGINPRDAEQLCHALAPLGVQLLLVVNDIEFEAYQVHVNEDKKIAFLLTVNISGPEDRERMSMDLAAYDCGTAQLLFRDKLSASNGKALWNSRNPLNDVVLRRIQEAASGGSTESVFQASTHVGIRAPLEIRYSVPRSGTLGEGFFPELEQVTRNGDVVYFRFLLRNVFDRPLRLRFGGYNRNGVAVCRDAYGGEYQRISGEAADFTLAPNEATRFDWAFRIGNRHIRTVQLEIPVAAWLGPDGSADTVLKFASVPVP